MNNEELGKHYNYSFKGLKLDPYRILSVYKITEPEQQHAVKKLLRAGKSVKSLEQDIDEVIMTLQRWKERLDEDSVPCTEVPPKISYSNGEFILPAFREYVYAK